MAASHSARKMLVSLCLRILHFCYYLVVSLSNLWESFNRRQPQHLTAKRTKIPSHLALLLVVSEGIDTETVENTFVESVVRVVTWCRAVGIRQLTVYDSQGVAVRCSQSIRMRLIADRPPCEDDTDSEVEYPLTPPPSDTSESRPLSPDLDGQPGVVIVEVAELQASKSRKPTRQWNVLKRRKQKYNTTPAMPLTLNLVSRELSKPAIALVAHSYVRTLRRIPRETEADLEFELSTDELGSTLEGRHGLPCPEFMIVHHISQTRNIQPSLELHGFPPWQIQLTELYHNKPPKSNWSSSASPSLLEEVEFRAALDEFASAEFRLGK